MSKEFKTYGSVEAAERAARQEAETEIRVALNNHADNIEHLNQGYEQMFTQATKQADQIDVLLDSVRLLTERMEKLEQARG